ncbi:efflux RND transporter periplasmic adaptor subunit [cf. Phormidesmis sp. LEGE 11477]|uniref:efflux RND transporter periplasmic adaptor subunit n=1 Tax=cf. Phormidesmis sp. LEGE 11477 TaxID=1828680 RepID=UPI00187E5471|nr:efflux RND transporter periplasmic adaptor subunit [cf. Phormidesmis sp. LEGE 11477]MBE9063857.1 efflux RND transporter periplasmic adaptor subunit [cf. Phormidesmis sp. LEGE 11477]
MATTSDPAIGSLKRRPSRKWIAGIGLVLLAGGLGFLFWRIFANSGPSEMEGPPPVPVRTERLESESLQDSAEFVGLLDAQAGVSLQPEADGRIVQIFVESGETVSAGAPIMQLSSQRSQSDYNAALASVSAARSSRDTASAQLRAARARLTELLADLELRNNDFDRTAALVAQGALPQSQLDEVVRDRTVAESALASSREEIAALESSLEGANATLSQANANAEATQQDLLDKTVTAPISGIVGNIPVSLGDYVQAGDQLATITQNQDLDLEIAIPIDESDRLRTGLPVELSLFGSDDIIATGAINFVSPTTDTDTQTVLAEARFSTPGQPLQDEQRLEVRVIWDERPGVLVSATAITRLGGETFVFVPGEPDPPETEEATEGPSPGQDGGQSNGQADGPPPEVAKLTSVELGDLQGNDYQVLDGLVPGDVIITEGILNLRDGVPIDTSGSSSPPEG